MLKRSGRKVQQWASDKVLRRLSQNAGTLLGGNVGASLLHLATLVLTARALGPKLFGLLALIRAYVFVVDRLVNFQSWQALIRYGAEMVERRQPEDFKQLVKFGTLLDVVSALLATGLAVAGAAWIGRWFGWDPRVARLAALYSVVIGFNLSGTPTAILRLFNRFNQFALQEVVSSALKLAGVAVGYLSGAGLAFFLGVWMATEIFGQLLLLAMGWRALRAQGFHRVLRVPLRGVTSRYPGLWQFVWTTNLNTSFQLASRELDTLMVGGLLGAASAGLYKVAKQCADSLERLSDPVYCAVYPELATLWAQGNLKQFKRLVGWASAVLGCVGLLAWLGFLAYGVQLLTLVFGAAYVGAASVLTWYLLGSVLDLCLLPIHPALLASGRPGTSFWINAGSALIYLPALYELTRNAGLAGSGMAYLLYFLLQTVALAAVVTRVLKQTDTASISIKTVPAR